MVTALYNRQGTIFNRIIRRDDRTKYVQSHTPNLIFLCSCKLFLKIAPEYYLKLLDKPMGPDQKWVIPNNHNKNLVNKQISMNCKDAKSRSRKRYCTRSASTRLKVILVAKSLELEHQNRNVTSDFSNLNLKLDK